MLQTVGSNQKYANHAFPLDHLIKSDKCYRKSDQLTKLSNEESRRTLVKWLIQKIRRRDTQHNRVISDTEHKRHSAQQYQVPLR